ncbi:MULTISPECIES: hypothetical protein [Burkholderia]|uniref:hypothetical protein n=1 Tax=Burkholderia TaxID=32008 RepID=UPI00064FA8D0|nr:MULTISPECIES: hypothetical protein [Burkholderia]KML19762.1 hypothetical protein VL00_06035 [Burkholderia cepacia]KMN59603.1 hypothetical protein VK92_15665 [Burkholderia sp. LK4]
MQGIRRFSGGERAVSIGTLEELQSFPMHWKWKQAAGMPGNIPVLTCPISMEDYDYLSSNQGRSNFGFGRVQLSSGMLMTIRMQLRGLQVYWLAEMTDPEIWRAIKMWQQAKRVPIAFKIDAGAGWDVTFCAHEIPEEKLSNEVFRTPDCEPTWHTWHSLATVAGSGLMQKQATTDIEGVPLRRVLVNAMLTKRLERFINERPSIVPPVIVASAA